MAHQTLSSLSRGYEKDGQAYKDHKIRFLEKIPYSLNDLQLGKVIKKDKGQREYIRLPGTYLTEKGQLILYTKPQEGTSLNQEISEICKNFTNVYDTVQLVSPSIKDEDINSVKKENKFHDLDYASKSLKSNWFYPKKWASPAKLLIPSKTDVRKFSKAQNQENPLNSNFSNVKNGKSRFSKYVQKYKDHGFLPKLNNKDYNFIKYQCQNNALEMAANSSPRQIDPKSYSKNIPAIEEHQATSGRNTASGINDNESCYEADDELIIRPVKIKKIKQVGDFEKLLSDTFVKMNISEVLGSDLISNDIKSNDHVSTILKPLRSTSGKSQKSEELRLNLLKDLYGKLDFLSMVKNSLITFGEDLLNQIQVFNAKNHKSRFRKMKDELYESLKNMKNCNDEIHLRLQKISEQQLLEKKDTMENTCFRAQWDNMLLELSAKSKVDNDALHNRMLKFIEREELKINDIETHQLKLEHSSIKYAFIKLKEELIKIEEKKQEIEHFIIRLEMKRENVNKIEREITTLAPDSLGIESINISTLIKKLKEDIIILWKSKMGKFEIDFKADECQMNHILNKENNISSFIKERGDTVNNSEVSNLITEGINSKEFNDLKKASNTGDIELSVNQQNNFLKKLDYEILKHGQRITSSYTYSYLVRWRKESYERDYKPPPSTDEEFETEKKRKTCKLNYKTILANNPLLKKRIKKQKTNLKKRVN